jgi:hypothetical protein
MEVGFSIKNWRIEKDEKTGTAKVVGKYDVVMNNKVIASQAFNGEYGSMDVPFSSDLLLKLKSCEDDILAELKRMFG